MATLYLAQRGGARGFARHLAIKVVHEDLAQDDIFVEMFIDEAKLAAQINHPNVVHVEDFGEADGSYFIAMEYINGCSLSQLLRALVKQKRRLTPELSVYIAVKLAEGLHAAHEATDPNGAPLNVVHRDVNPANVLLAYEGHVKLIDFGIAKSSSRAHQTTGGSLKGKLRYMSPEQAMGKAIDRRADIYALGITLWETLTARRLFDAETDIQVLETVRNPNIEPPSRYAEGVSSDLDAIVMSALNPAPEARMPTALDMRKQLTRAMPEAAMLDSSSLSELLGIVMRRQIQKRQSVLPESLAGGAKVSPPPQDEDEILRTMTISDVGLELAESEDRTSVSKSIPGDPAPPAPVGVPFTAEHATTTPDTPAAPAVSHPTGTPAEPDYTPPMQKRWPVFAGLGAVLTVAVVTVAVMVGSPGDDVGEATVSDEVEAAPTTVEPANDEAETAPATDEPIAAGPGETTAPVAVAIAEEDAGAAEVEQAETSRPVEPASTPVESSTAMRHGRTRPRTPRMSMMATTRQAMMRSGAPSLVDDVF